MSNWNYIVIGMSALLLIFLIWKEVIRLDKRFLALRILLSVTAVASLAILGYENDSAKEKSSPQQSIVLLTDGYNKDSVARFLQSTNASLYSTESTTQNAIHITDLSYLKKLAAQNKSIHVFGWGLDKSELQLLSDTPVSAHLDIAPPGFQSVSWMQNLKPGEKLRIQGHYNNSDPKPRKIILSGFNTPLDSVSVQGQTAVDISFTTIPRHLGRAVYSMYTLQGNDTIEVSPVPVQIGEASAMKILMLASSPDFDNRFLKNWLSTNGYEVVSKTLISKSKYARDFSNSDLNTLTYLGKDLLQNFDVIVTDQQSLTSLSAAELSTLQEKISTGGLGLIVKADSSSRLFYATRFPLQHSGNQNREQIKLHLGDSSNHLQPLAVQQAVYIQPSSGSKPLLRDNRDRIFANSILYGKGTIVLSTLLNSYSWALAGKNEDYHALWSSLLYNASRKKDLSETWSISPAFPVVDEPVSVTTETAAKDLPKAIIGGANIYLQQDLELPFSWNGKYWPKKAGWQAGIAMNGSPYYWYAFNKSDWKAVRANEKLIATRDYVRTHISDDKNSKEPVVIRKVKLPGYFFFALFVLSCGALWIRIKGLGS